MTRRYTSNVLPVDTERLKRLLAEYLPPEEDRLRNGCVSRDFCVGGKVASFRDFAEAVGVTDNTLYRVARTGVASLATLDKLSATLNVNLDSLIAQERQASA